MRSFASISLFAVSLVSAANAVELPKHGLSLIYSRDNALCARAANLLGSDKACRSEDATNCSDAEMQSVTMDGMSRQVIEELATNEYGYTKVAKSSSSAIKGFAVIYVSLFQGDHSPRLVQTWKVDDAKLKAVMDLPPGPVPYERWIQLNPRHPRETNAKEFAALLENGEKISSEWSPVVDMDGIPFASIRECSGLWVFGGYYACNRVIKITLVRLDGDKKSLPYCQFGKHK